MLTGGASLGPGLGPKTHLYVGMEEKVKAL